MNLEQVGDGECFHRIFLEAHSDDRCIQPHYIPKGREHPPALAAGVKRRRGDAAFLICLRLTRHYEPDHASVPRTTGTENRNLFGAHLGPTHLVVVRLQVCAKENLVAILDIVGVGPVGIRRTTNPEASVGHGMPIRRLARLTDQKRQCALEVVELLLLRYGAARIEPFSRELGVYPERYLCCHLDLLLNRGAFCAHYRVFAIFCQIRFPACPSEA